MDFLIDTLRSADFWKLAFPALAAIVAWFVNERAKLSWEQYKRKEENYKELLRCLRGFYVATQDKTLKDQFLHQVNLLWLYAPDDVVVAAYDFLDSVKTGSTSSSVEKDSAAGAVVATVRRDLLSRRIVSRTSMDKSKFRHFHAN